MSLLNILKQELFDLAEKCHNPPLYITVEIYYHYQDTREGLNAVRDFMYFNEIPEELKKDYTMKEGRYVEVQ